MAEKTGCTQDQVTTKSLRLTWPRKGFASSLTASSLEELGHH
jgi:hypothetical protein